jgi:hypothetical protein
MSSFASLPHEVGRPTPKENRQDCIAAVPKTHANEPVTKKRASAGALFVLQVLFLISPREKAC